jgi:hypothetical protein
LIFWVRVDKVRDMKIRGEYIPQIHYGNPQNIGKTKVACGRSVKAHSIGGLEQISEKPDAVTCKNCRKRLPKSPAPVLRNPVGKVSLNEA